ncbi:MAG: SHOCT domain-containing protein [Clostridia bacterium]|nr:SHOCT domain-containing protein [Clostridia bacterium]
MDALTFSFFAFLIRGVFLGFVTQHIATSKGYETGFAWGFWLGLIGVFVVAVKPEVNVSAHNYGEKNQYWKRLAGETPKQAPWCCVCGQENVADLQYCTRCGRTKEEGESKAFVKVECSYCGAKNNASNEECFACGRSLKNSSYTPAVQTVRQETPKQVVGDVDSLEALKKLAELRDLGVLTENEFQEKKAAIMAKI